MPGVATGDLSMWGQADEIGAISRGSTDASTGAKLDCHTFFYLLFHLMSITFPTYTPVVLRNDSMARIAYWAI